MSQPLFDHIEEIKDRIARPAAGLLPFRYVVPTAASGSSADRQSGVYEQQYDWDAYFESVALGYDGGDRALLVRDAVKNVLHVTTGAGFTPRTVSPEKFWDFPDQMKPFLAQWCLLGSRVADGVEWLAEDGFDRVLANLSYWDAHRRGGHGLYMWRSSLESGVDNNATSVNTPDLSIESVDVNSYLVRELRAAAILARELGRGADAQRLERASVELAHRMNVVLWDEESGCYTDVVSVSDAAVERVRVKSWTCLTPLWAGVAPADRARRLIEEHVLDPECYWGAHGVPSLARNERVYNQGRRGLLYIAVEQRRWEVSNWQGPVWIIANWQVMHGLLAYGYGDRAVELASRIVELLDRDVRQSGHMHENYDAETGIGLWSPRFGSWNLLAAKMLDEAESDFDPTFLGRRL